MQSCSRVRFHLLTLCMAYKFQSKRCLVRLHRKIYIRSLQYVVPLVPVDNFAASAVASLAASACTDRCRSLAAPVSRWSDHQNSSPGRSPMQASYQQTIRHDYWSCVCCMLCEVVVFVCICIYLYRCNDQGRKMSQFHTKNHIAYHWWLMHRGCGIGPQVVALDSLRHRCVRGRRVRGWGHGH